MLKVTAKRKITRFEFGGILENRYLGYGLCSIISDIIDYQNQPHENWDIPVTIISNSSIARNISQDTEQLGNSFTVTKSIEDIDCIKAISCGFEIKILLEERD